MRGLSFNNFLHGGGDGALASVENIANLFRTGTFLIHLLLCFMAYFRLSNDLEFAPIERRTPDIIPFLNRRRGQLRLNNPKQLHRQAHQERDPKHLYLDVINPDMLSPEYLVSQSFASRPVRLTSSKTPTGCRDLC